MITERFKYLKENGEILQDVYFFRIIARLEYELYAQVHRVDGAVIVDSISVFMNGKQIELSEEEETFILEELEKIFKNY